MNYPDREASLKILKEWKRQHESLTILMANMEASIGLDIDGPMFSVVWGLFGAYTKNASELLGDKPGASGSWLEWFYLENNMGDKGMDAGYEGKVKPIKTLADLLDLIEQGRQAA